MVFGDVGFGVGCEQGMWPFCHQEKGPPTVSANGLNTQGEAKSQRGTQWVITPTDRFAPKFYFLPGNGGRAMDSPFA